MQQRAVLAGGCFWGMQDLIRRLPGVVSTRVGYTGGATPNATYRNHGTHAEAIEIVFDTAKTSYRRILEYFFQIHDPTTRNRQGNDIGTSYRSAIFYTSDEQRMAAEETIADANASGLWPAKVVTEVTPAGDFWEAEPEHQDYLERYPNGYTCHFPRPNWVVPQRFLDRQRRSLVSLRAELLAAAKTHESEESQVNEQAAGMAHEYGDDGQKLAALELAGNLVVHDVARLGRVNRALEKIADGTYGLSDVSGSPISHERLEAVPEAVCTFDEEAEYERRQSR